MKNIFVVRTRFAPSPTGYMHIGNLRTALYAYLYARANNGVFVLRIEDTDRRRYVDGAVDVIYKTLALSGLKYDEGPDIGGDYGPYVQSERLDVYKKYAEMLVEKGAAYYCFCDKSEDDMQDKENFAGYDRSCRGIDPLEAAEKVRNGAAFVIRQKMPLSGVTVYNDAVFGEIKVDNSELDDQVLIKRDGMPTYNFANVVDDHLMNITHVIRGTEYIISTPKYKLLYEAFGWEVPTFIHLPLIMGQNEDGSVSKLSKRHGATSFEDLMNMGYLSEAIINYIALLGWNPKTNEEIFTLKQLEDKFSLAGISRSPSVFDYKKLDWINSQYLSNLSDEEFAQLSYPYAGDIKDNLKTNWIKVAAILKTRVSRLDEVAEKIAFLNETPDYDIALYENKKNKSSVETSISVLSDLSEILKSNVKSWDNDSLFSVLSEYAKEKNIKTGHVMWPLRIALSGLAVTPGGATEIMEILGEEESMLRIETARKRLENALSK